MVKKELAHETFALERYVPTDDKYQVKDKDGYFNFCKTAEKPYDLYVVAMLVFANHLAPDALKISSDGNWSDWKNGFRLAKSLHHAIRIPKFLEDDFKRDMALEYMQTTGQKIEGVTIH